MELNQFLTICDSVTPPSTLSPLLKALWFDKRGEWDKAHEEIQEGADSKSAAMHAYLHRKEGDIWNARYWYNHAKRRPFHGSLDEEWRTLALEFLSAGSQ